MILRPNFTLLEPYESDGNSGMGTGVWGRRRDWNARWRLMTAKASDGWWGWYVYCNHRSGFEKSLERSEWFRTYFRWSFHRFHAPNIRIYSNHTSQTPKIPHNSKSWNYLKNSPQTLLTFSSTLSAIHRCILTPGWKSFHHTHPLSAPLLPTSQVLFLSPIIVGSSNASLKIGVVSMSIDFMPDCEACQVWNAEKMWVFREFMARRWRRMLVREVTRTWGVRSNALGVLVVDVFGAGGMG